MSHLAANQDKSAAPTDEPKESTPSRRDLEIKEKKAMLYSLKSKLLKYDSFEEVPIEELDQLCENLNFQNQSNATNSEQQIADQPPTSQRREYLNRNISQEVFEGGIGEGYCRSAYVVKLKEIMVIVLVVLCIVVKSNIPTSTTYDMGEFSIYETRYVKSQFGGQKKGKKEDASAGFKFLQKLLGVEEDNDEHIKLYLPKGLQKIKKKEQRDLSYQNCIDSYSPVCIDHRLSLYGSMNLQLEDWVIDHITGQEKIVFESSVQYILSILLSALKMKKLEAQGRPVKKITLIQSEHLNIIELNSIKLSLIENQCQNYVEIMRMEHEEFDKLAAFDYVLVSQEFYVYYVYPFGQSLAKTYPDTSFLVYMPSGINETTKILLKQEIGSRSVYQIKFQFQDDTFYIERQLAESDLVLNKDDKKYMMVLIRPADTQKGNAKDGNLAPISISNPSAQTLSNALISQPMNQIPLPADAITEETPSMTPSSIPSISNLQSTSSLPLQNAASEPKERELILEEHPCIQQNKYDILPIMSSFDNYSYIDTISGFKLLVSSERALQYKQKGAISPQLLFFISQNINQKDIVFYAYQLYHDDLVLLTAAKKVKKSQYLYCLLSDTTQPILTENLRMNGLQELVSLAYINIQEEARTRNFYKQHDFTVIFTSFSFLMRDYKAIYDANKPKLVVFYWLVDVNYLNFVKELARRHKVWAILERFEKLNFMDSCMNYGLQVVHQEGVLQVDRSWLVVQM